MKRLIGFLMGCSLFIVLGSLQVLELDLLRTLIMPLRWIGQGLRYLSLESGMLNVMATVLFILIIFIPVGYLVYKMKKSTVHKVDVVFLPLLTLVFGVTLHYFINPHLLYNGLNQDFKAMMGTDSLATIEVILLSGVAYIFYIVVAIYAITIMYVSEQLRSIDVFKVLMDAIMVIYAFSVLTIGLSGIITVYNETLPAIEQTIQLYAYIGDVILFGLTVYILNLFRRFIVLLHQDGFEPGLLNQINRIYVLSFVLLIATLCLEAVINLIQFMVLDQLLNVSFSFDLPIVMLLMVLLLYIFSRYVKRVIELKQDSELII
jgi:hypothetical protein